MCTHSFLNPRRCNCFEDLRFYNEKKRDKKREREREGIVKPRTVIRSRRDEIFIDRNAGRRLRRSTLVLYLKTALRALMAVQLKKDTYRIMVDMKTVYCVFRRLFNVAFYSPTTRLYYPSLSFSYKTTRKCSLHSSRVESFSARSISFSISLLQSAAMIYIYITDIEMRLQGITVLLDESSKLKRFSRDYSDDTPCQLSFEEKTSEFCPSTSTGQRPT